MGKYINPIPTVDLTGKNIIIRPIFSYDEPLTLEEASKGINRIIEEKGGKIPVEWLGFTDN